MVSSSTKSLHNRQLDEINRLKYEARQAADTIERLQKDNDAGRELMNQACNEFNAIRARDGAPPGVSHEWWDQITESLHELLGDDSKPWMTGAAKALVDPYLVDLSKEGEARIKAEQERDTALAEVERLQKERDDLSKRLERMHRPRCDGYSDDPKGPWPLLENPCQFCGARSESDACRDMSDTADCDKIRAQRDAALTEVERLKGQDNART